MIKTAGLSLLVVGYLSLAAAALIRDETAPDANIGAGLLTLLGLPAGALGLVLLVVATLARRSRQI